eukprot:5799873-Pyramimonas_sp.AAC.1
MGVGVLQQLGSLQHFGGCNRTAAVAQAWFHGVLTGSVVVLLWLQHFRGPIATFSWPGCNSFLARLQRCPGPVATFPGPVATFPGP